MIRSLGLGVVAISSVALLAGCASSYTVPRGAADFRSLGSRSLAEVTDDALRRAQEWLADESRPSERLTFLTEGAVSAAEGEDADPIGAALWGLVRSAQAEHPGRFALLDLDPGEASRARLDAALAAGVKQPQLALRKGVALVPRLARALGGAETTDDPFDSEATVLITGAPAALGSLRGNPASGAPWAV